MKKLLFVLLLLSPVLGFSQSSEKSDKKTQGMPCCEIKPVDEFANLAKDINFRNIHDEPVLTPLSENTGEMVSFPTADGKKGSGFLVKSEKESDVYVIMIHEWWGLNNQIKNEALKYYNEMGNVNVIALDLYDGKVADNREDASKYMQSVSNERAVHIINGALAMAGKNARILTIGWCFGGGWSLQAGLLAGKQNKATVIYYGMPESNPEKLNALNGPVLGIWAKKDGWINEEVVAKFETGMQQAGKSVFTSWYDADHAFANPSNPNYDKEAAADAYKKVLALFQFALLF